MLSRAVRHRDRGRPHLEHAKRVLSSLPAAFRGPLPRSDHSCLMHGDRPRYAVCPLTTGGHAFPVVDGTTYTDNTSAGVLRYL